MKNKGLKLWDRAMKAIPGGNGLLSKRPDRYAPDIWPTYFSKAKGIKVWDLEDNEYTDMAQMGIGTCILGYGDDYVDSQVIDAVKTGVSCTLNPPEEVLLAEELLKLNPFASGVRFARTGGEAMAMAVRIARTHSKKDVVAFSGYHGWSDWYLATNLKGDNKLSQHLLPGLSPNGVPKGLEGTARPFLYNNVEDLHNVISDEVGTIIIEGARYDFPKPEFLEAIQKIAKEKGILIIVDEITSGWRMTDGGVFKLNGLKPDIVVYGKALGNGYAISAILGTKEVMDSSQDSFISSTFFTERVGFVAALATLKRMQETKIWVQLNSIGTIIGDKWLELSKKHGLNLSVTDYKPLITFKLDHGDQNQKLITLFTQEMLKKKYLAASSIYLTLCHTEDVLDEYFSACDTVFETMAKAIKEDTLDSLLETAPREDGFKRLN